MNNMKCNEVFQTAFQEVRKESILNDLRSLHVDGKLDYVEKVYKAALEHPRTPVKLLLKHINVTDCQYKTMRQTHMSIAQYRKQALGTSRFYSTEQRDAISKRMKDIKRRSKRVKDHKKFTGNGAELNSSYLMDRLQKNNFDLDND